MGIEFKTVDFLPWSAHVELRELVQEFIVYSNPGAINHEGYFQQIIDNMEKALSDGVVHKLWLLADEKKLLGFVLSNITVDVDNSPCFNIYLAYARKEGRGKPVRECLRILREEARRVGCKYLIAPTTRNEEAMRRFLGRGATKYCTLLKEKL